MEINVDLKVNVYWPHSWPDGKRKKGGILSYNQKLPGPTISATEGDTVIVKVTNELAEPTTVHWHGMYQHGSWFMDGVYKITQPSIPPGGCFKYRFKAEPHGTHWYHSHLGVQYSDGLFGPLIIKERENPYQCDYDCEHVIMINDWFHEPSSQILENLKQGKYMMGEAESGMDVGDVPFESALINGKGRYTPGSKSDLETFTVKKDERIRFRIINASSTYAFKFAIEQHKLSVIAADGMLTERKEVDNIVVNIGERYDVIVHANQEVNNYQICACTLEPDKNNCVVAILKYEGACVYLDKDRGICCDNLCSNNTLNIMELRPHIPTSIGRPTKTFELPLSGSMKPYQWEINGKIFQLPMNPITLAYPPETMTQIQIDQDDIVRIILNNKTMMSHPFHLHGHSFYVLGQSQSRDGNHCHGQPLNEDNPIRKDVIDVPMGGWAVIQFVADNPGWWFFHCHIEWHLATGMALVVSEGEPPVPPQELGSC